MKKNNHKSCSFLRGRNQNQSEERFIRRRKTEHAGNKIRTLHEIHRDEI